MADPTDLDRLDALHREFIDARLKFEREDSLGSKNKACSLFMFVKGHGERLRYALFDAYPALAAELRALRAELAAIGTILGDRDTSEPLTVRVYNVTVELYRLRCDERQERAENGRLREQARGGVHALQRPSAPEGR